jgi:hypothetical protein
VAGYSATPLASKLGVRDGMTVMFVNAPASVIGVLPETVVQRRRAGPGIDVAALFTTRRSELVSKIPGLSKAIFPNGSLWIGWPKQASGVSTEIDENTIREVALPTGLVDNKVCAIDDTWSALRLVWRKEKRT